MSLTEQVERSSLLMLKDSLSDAQSSTKKMLSKLERFEKRLGNLDSKISSIQTTTENYSRARENIVSILSEVQKTSEYFRVAKEVEPAIKAKFGNSKAFFTAIERLTNAQKFFIAHEKGIKASGQALKTIDALLKVRVSACQRQHKLLLVMKSDQLSICCTINSTYHARYSSIVFFSAFFSSLSYPVRFHPILLSPTQWCHFFSLKIEMESVGYGVHSLLTSSFLSWQRREESRPVLRSSRNFFHQVKKWSKLLMTRTKYVIKMNS